MEKRHFKTHKVSRNFLSRQQSKELSQDKRTPMDPKSDTLLREIKVKGFPRGWERGSIDATNHNKGGPSRVEETVGSGRGTLRRK